jgi:hypothetical protein
MPSPVSGLAIGALSALTGAGIAAGPHSPAGPAHLDHAGHRYPLYPETTADLPDLPSPLTTPDGREYVIIRLHDGRFGLVDVTRREDQRQCDLDTDDFPSLAITGRHDHGRLARLETITGRSLAEIDSLAAPGALSSSGFLAADETVLSVLRGDDALVAAMGLTHTQLARPLLHVWNLMQTDLALDRWNMARHQWCNVDAVLYNGHWVLLDAHDTKGGQQSPFADGLTGGFWIVIQRPLSGDEQRVLHERYPFAAPSSWDTMHGTLSRLWIGEMEAFFIQWYGFYEGHVDWRADPVGIASVFGLRTLAELEAAFPGRLHDVTNDHHVARR